MFPHPPGRGQRRRRVRPAPGPGRHTPSRRQQSEPGIILTVASRPAAANSLLACLRASLTSSIDNSLIRASSHGMRGQKAMLSRSPLKIRISCICAVIEMLLLVAPGALYRERKPAIQGRAARFRSEKGMSDDAPPRLPHRPAPRRLHAGMLRIRPGCQWSRTPRQVVSFVLLPAFGSPIGPCFLWHGTLKISDGRRRCHSTPAAPLAARRRARSNFALPVLPLALRSPWRPDNAGVASTLRIEVQPRPSLGDRGKATRAPDRTGARPSGLCPGHPTPKK